MDITPLLYIVCRYGLSPVFLTLSLVSLAIQKFQIFMYLNLSFPLWLRVAFTLRKVFIPRL